MNKRTRIAHMKMIEQTFFRTMSVLFVAGLVSIFIGLVGFLLSGGKGYLTVLSLCLFPVLPTVFLIVEGWKSRKVYASNKALLAEGMPVSVSVTHLEPISGIVRLSTDKGLRSYSVDDSGYSLASALVCEASFSKASEYRKRQSITDGFKDKDGILYVNSDGCSGLLIVNDKAIKLRSAGVSEFDGLVNPV